MHIAIITLFSEMFEPVLRTSMLGRAIEQQAMTVELVNLRDFGLGKHNQVDDRPYGGGAGMLLMVEPLVAATEHALGLLRAQGVQDPAVVMLSPQGRPLKQPVLREYAGREGFVLVCGRYEGVDERFRELLVTEELSVGDYVLTGGELPAMIVLDGVCRLLPGVLGDERSAEDESFSEDALEYPHYTRPEAFRGLGVPDVLRSGHHAQIDQWRRTKSLEKTARVRPDLLEKAKTR